LRRSGCDPEAKAAVSRLSLRDGMDSLKISKAEPKSEGGRHAEGNFGMTESDGGIPRGRRNSAGGSGNQWPDTSTDADSRRTGNRESEGVNP
jgi:hypothetical protein